MKRDLNGLKWYALLFQVASLLPLPYLLIGIGMPSLFRETGVFSVLFRCGVSCLPRAESILTALLYFYTGKETVWYFALLLFAFLFGMGVNRLAAASSVVRLRAAVCFAVLVFADLILRLLPLPCNGVFSLWYNLAGGLFRLICLGLLIWEIVRCKKTTE